MSAGKRVARAVLGDYSIFRILQLEREDPVTAASGRFRLLGEAKELETSDDEEIRALVQYAGDDALCFVAEEDGAIAAACWYWHGETYVRRRHYWPLAPAEAKLIQITTARARRGRGLARELIRHSSQQMFAGGFTRLYARVWHSHQASLYAFREAGWRQIALVLDVEPFGRPVRLCARFPAGSSARRWPSLELGAR